MEDMKTVYTYEDALAHSCEYFNGDEAAAQVWLDKYALRDAEGNICEVTPSDMHHRLASELARIEAKYPNPLSEEKIYSLLDHFRYIIPAGSSMAGIGNDKQLTSLSNCFVIGIPGDADSYGAIMKIDEELVQLMKRRGGVGHDLSQLRPKGAVINNSALISTGLKPMMERFCNSSREVEQKGNRGSLVLSVNVKHPDAEVFIDSKLTESYMTNARLTIRLDDAFLHAVKKDENYVQQFPVEGDEPIVTNEISARDLWKKIIQNAWNSADPSVVFWDTVTRESVSDCYKEMGFGSVSTNPCGEVPLCPYDSCRLLTMNLYSYVVNPFTPESRFNFELFRQHAAIAQRLMDDIVDLEIEKIERILEKIDNDPQDECIKATERQLWLKILDKCKKGRRTGLGVTAEADMFAAMGLRYGSDEAIGFAVNVQRTLALAAYRSSVTMAKERGAFAIYDADLESTNPFIMRIKENDAPLVAEMVQHGRRNIGCLTIAPTGTLSMMTQTTSGIEPAFNVVYHRRKKMISDVDDSTDTYEEYLAYHSLFVKWMKLNGYDVSQTYDEVELQTIIARSPYAQATALEVNPIDKVHMQGAIQQWVDHAISITINLPEDAPEELVSDIYMEAWKSGCKGCTIYREGSRHFNAEDDGAQGAPAAVIEVRPQSLECDVVRFQNNKEKWVAFVGLLDGHPYEIFTGLQDDEEGIALPKSVTKGRIIKNSLRDGTRRYDFQFENKRGYKTTIEGLSEKFNKEYWNYAKLISGVLRYKMPVDRVLKLVSSLQLGDENINTWKTGVERALKKYVKNGTKAGGVCPHCGHDSLIYQEGCITCRNCGSSKCS